MPVVRVVAAGDPLEWTGGGAGVRLRVFAAERDSLVLDTVVAQPARPVRTPALPPGANDDGETTVEVRPGKALRRPVTLAEIKADAELAGWDLIRLPRLSVVPVTETQWRRVISLAEADG